jgi:hypothetical protein
VNMAGQQPLNYHASVANRPLTILFSGMIAADHGQGGATWAVLQYLLGFERLGHKICFVEPLRSSSIRPAGSSLAESKNAAYFREVVKTYGFEDRAALVLDNTDQTVGLPYSALREIARNCDLLVNVSGMLTDGALIAPIPVRVYLDLDPAFIQLWHLAEHIDMRFAAHTHFVTVGKCIGRDGCDVPTCDLPWIHTFPPVVLDEWLPVETLRNNALTTIANWRGYGSIQHGGIHFGQKAHSFRQFIRLPQRTSQVFEPALDIHAGETRDLELLAENGWHVLDGRSVVATPAAYRDFVRQSWAEIGIAKSGYVNSKCGWFSDRSASYLAAGRPVIAQETGFSQFLPTGRGLFAFTTEQDVVDAIEAIRADYAAHALAARALAATHFDSDVVLARLLRKVGVIH